MPRVFPCDNVLSPVSSMLLMLWNPQFHIYGIRQLLVPPRSTARSRSYGSYPPSLMSGKLTAHFLPLYMENLGLAKFHLCILTIWVKATSWGEFFPLLVDVFILLFLFLNKFTFSYHKTPWVDMLSYWIFSRLGLSLGHNIGFLTVLKSNTVNMVNG